MLLKPAVGWGEQPSNHTLSTMPSQFFKKPQSQGEWDKHCLQLPSTPQEGQQITQVYEKSLYMFQK